MDDNRGFLIPPWFRSGIPQAPDMELCSIIWGASLCCAVFTATKASRQTWTVCRRRRRLSAYVAMIWAEWLSSVTISIVCWFFLKGMIQPSFWLFFAILCLWTIQMQCILQIILNRISLLVVDRRRARQLQLGTFVAITLINISVFCIWIPAQLQISNRYTHLNDIWDRTEKAIFATIDAGLNTYFLWVVRTKLIANGLTKYWALFRYNIAMVCISVSLDLVLIGSMSLPSGLIYIQFHPLTYLIKLHIELNLAELIAKVVQASNPLNDMTSATTAVEPQSPQAYFGLGGTGRSFGGGGGPLSMGGLGGVVNGSMKQNQRVEDLGVGFDGGRGRGRSYSLDAAGGGGIDLGSVPLHNHGLLTGIGETRRGSRPATQRSAAGTAELRLDLEEDRLYPTGITWQDRFSIQSAPTP
ncbi:hypothetical protein PG999_013082 [Apiospora kogelbergensis]|uniref:Uncharacterized protein n=1 Tax=Apiospora kogelbergensis TaxID=1337665 RepID=A0AAW0Q8U7_9PEZI